jgi:hypothetical protein
VVDVGERMRWPRMTAGPGDHHGTKILSRVWRSNFDIGGN